MKFSRLALLLLPTLAWSEPHWIQFETFPTGAEVYQEFSGGPQFKGLTGKKVPIEVAQVSDPRGQNRLLLPGRIQFRKKGHQPLTVTVSAEDWLQTRLPRSGSYQLVADNPWVAVRDWFQAYPWAFLLGALGVLGVVRWRFQLSKISQQNQKLIQRQKPGDDPWLGSQLASYQIVERLGQGGMATVYRAQINQRNYALKLLVSDKTHPESASRFRRECRLAAQLHHPALVRVIEFGEVDQVLYLVMELVEGRPLPLGPEGMEWEEIWPWYRQLLVGIGYAHAMGVVHRDLKPQNILVTAVGDVKVVDFGLARTKEIQAITETGHALGTPSYLAPEQLTGGGTLVEARSDQYSLGVILYQALTGSPPFVGLDAKSVANQHLSAVPLPLRMTRPDLPEQLEQIVARMLAKDPIQRFPGLSIVMEQLAGLKIEPGLVRAAVNPLISREEETREF